MLVVVSLLGCAKTGRCESCLSQRCGKSQSPEDQALVIHDNVVLFLLCEQAARLTDSVKDSVHKAVAGFDFDPAENPFGHSFQVPWLLTLSDSAMVKFADRSFTASAIFPSIF